MHEINISMAAFPGLRHHLAVDQALRAARSGRLREPAFGALSTRHIQLVPQNMGRLDESLAAALCEAYPDVQFRLHANVRLLDRHRIADLSSYAQHADWFAQAARVHRVLGAKAYTAHSGSRALTSIDDMLDNARRCADLFGCPVGVEGQYPTDNDSLLVSSWREYEYVMRSGVPYAVDLSHLTILACKSGNREDALVREMLASPACIEVHLSDNDGRGDQHQICDEQTWWMPLLPHINPGAVVFSEGNHLRRMKRNSHVQSR